MVERTLAVYDEVSSSAAHISVQSVSAALAPWSGSVPISARHGLGAHRGGASSPASASMTAAVGLAIALVLVCSGTVRRDRSSSGRRRRAAHRLIFWRQLRGRRAAHRPRARHLEGTGRRRVRLHDRAPARARRRPGLQRRPEREPGRSQLRAAALAARLADRRAGEGARDEALPRRQARQLLQRRHPAQGLVRRRGLVEARCCRRCATWRRRRSCSGSPESPSTRSSTPHRSGAATATWAWDYPGNTHSEAQVRAKARQRGRRADGRDPRRLSGRRAGGLPRASSRQLARVGPGGGQRHPNTSADRLDIDFWDGMTSVDGYGAIRFFDSIFYKAPHSGSWESALTYNANQVLATFSRRFSNWDYASERVHVSPFSWIDDGPKPSSLRRRPLARVRRRAAARLSQVGHGRRVRKLRLRAARRFRLLALRARDAGRLEARHASTASPRRSSSPRPQARRSRAPRTTTSRSAPCGGRTIAADRASPG